MTSQSTTRSVTEADGSTHTETLLTVYTLDDKGRVTSTTHPDGSVTTTEYNGIDKPVRECDALQRCTATQYTARGEVERIDYPDGTFEAKTYDPNGNLQSQTDRAGRTTGFEYDAANRLTRTIHPDPASDDGNDSNNPVGEAKSELHKLRRIIADFPEVNAAISKAGRPEDGTDPKNINMTEMLVDLKPESAWRKGMTKDQLIREMEDKLNDVPGIEPSFSQPVRDQILESISQIDGQIVIKLFGDDTVALKRYANQLLDKIGNVPGVLRAFIDRDGDLPQYRLEIDRAAAARYGLNVMDVQDVVETAMAGKAATELWEGDRHFSVVLRLDEPSRQLDKLKDVLVPTPSGAQVPLSSLVDFKLGSGAMNIARESGQRVVAIGVFIRDRDMGSVVADMQNHAKDLKLPPGYSIAWSGEFENQERAMKRLMLVVPLSILVIFVLLFDAFESFKDALIIICNIPFALIGGIFALLISGIPLSVSAAIGFIALFGQAVLNGVVMVSYINQLKLQGMDAYQSVFQGALSRLRTVLMTALLAMLGLLPMALSHGIGSETQRPLALVVIGGLISATLLTLFVLPALYYFVATHPRLARALH